MKIYMSNQKAALSHAHAYVYEELERYGYDYDGADGLIKATQKNQDHCRTLAGVGQKSSQISIP